jgi:hypothetical protein
MPDRPIGGEPLDGKQLPDVGKALQGVRSAVIETQTRSGDEVLDSAGYQYLARPGERCHARADMDGNSGDVVAAAIAFAGVHSCAHIQAKLAVAIDRRDRAPDRAGGHVEGGEDSVARRVDLAATKTHERSADALIVRLEQVAPGIIADFGQDRGRIDDVGEHDGREYPLLGKSYARGSVAINPEWFGLGERHGESVSTRVASHIDRAGPIFWRARS